MTGRAGVGGYSKPEGAKMPHSSGYTVIKKDGLWPLEHRVVMEEKLGRPLLADEHVHHVNGIRTDNSPENLELWSGHKDPKGQRVRDLAKHYMVKLSPEERSTLLAELNA